ncbi:cyclic nucleotide-binding domain-containing protein [Candidatus Sumerlaeota bacterium]|nr:cyclic nucleotide-binding domain-containing protein [Candidatus Sumerlaeota bacterium]
MSNLPPAVEQLPLRRVSRGETLIEEGKTQAELYFLVSGAVEIVKGGVQIVRVTDPGAVFGEMSILLKQPHSAEVRALEDSEFRVAARPEEILRDSPELALYIAEILARRLDALNRYLVDVKTQFKERADHLGMLDEILDALMNKHPRKIERRAVREP